MTHKHENFTRRSLDGAVMVVVEGEIDLAIAGRFAEELEDAVRECSPNLLIDLTGVTFIDSTGLSALVVGHRCATAAGGWLRLVGPSARVSRLLVITGLDQLLPAYDSVDDARSDSSRLESVLAATPLADAPTPAGQA